MESFLNVFLFVIGETLFPISVNLKGVLGSITEQQQLNLIYVLPLSRCLLAYHLMWKSHRVLEEYLGMNIYEHNL